jgi:hypothetical protein
MSPRGFVAPARSALGPFLVDRASMRWGGSARACIDLDADTEIDAMTV